MKLMTLKSNDFVDYFDVNEFEPNCVFNETNWCGLRAHRAKQLTNLETDFGMLFSKFDPIKHSNWQYSQLEYHGYCLDSSFHIWNKSEGCIYDGQKQAKINDWNLVDVDQEVAVVDGSSLALLFRNFNYKNQDKVFKFFKKALFNASRYGIQNLYVRGIAWNPHTGLLMTTRNYNENVPIYEQRVNQYFSKYGAPVNK